MVKKTLFNELSNQGLMNEVIQLIKILRFSSLKYVEEPQTYLSYKKISKIVGISQSYVRKICLQIKQNNKNILNTPNKQNTQLTKQQQQYLGSQQVLQKWSSYTLQERQIYYHRVFTNSKITPSSLYRFYKQNSIKFKKVYQEKPTIDKLKVNEKELLNLLLDQVNNSMSDGKTILFTDETLFTFNTQQKKAFSSKYLNIKVDTKKMSHTTKCLLGSIPKEVGIEHYMIFEKSVDSTKFINYLKELRQKTNDRKITIFLDNLKVHHSFKVKEACQKLNFEVIYNIPYKPQLNAIENLWSLIKNNFKRLKLKNALSDQPRCVEDLIKSSIKAISSDTARNICCGTLDKMKNHLQLQEDLILEPSQCEGQYANQIQ